MMSRRRVIAVTAGIMLSLLMASMEATVVATAMPTIVQQLGGLERYSWVFSIYMLTSTTTVPVYGKLSDVYGRWPIYAVSMGLFLVASVLCGRATTMDQLIVFRGLQGLGAGGVLPVAFILVGDLFNVEERARMQGLFSGMWGLSSIIGPLMGGFLVDQVSWHWVFYVNVAPGLLAAGLVLGGWRDDVAERESRVRVDYAGAILLTAAVTVLLLGLFELGTPRSWLFLGVALLLFVALAWIERRAADPVLPLGLFRDRLFAVGCGHGVMSGWAVFGTTAFVPLFVQAVLGASATAAGSTLTPQIFGWVGASIIGSRLLLRIGYRTMALAGTILLTVGAFLLTQVEVSTSRVTLMAYLALMGIGMGLSIPAFMLAIQSSVRRRELGTATSTLQFSRSIGGTLGVSIMGAVLTLRLANALSAAGLDPNAVSVDALLAPVGGAAVASEGAVRLALAGAIQDVFFLAFIAAVLGLAVTALTPRGRVSQPESEPQLASSQFAEHS